MYMQLLVERDSLVCSSRASEQAAHVNQELCCIICWGGVYVCNSVGGCWQRLPGRWRWRLRQQYTHVD
jgi:hypothetical protein